MTDNAALIERLRNAADVEEGCDKFSPEAVASMREAAEALSRIEAGGETLSDLIETLKNSAEYDPLCRDALDYIKKLERKNEALMAAAKAVFAANCELPEVGDGGTIWLAQCIAGAKEELQKALAALRAVGIDPSTSDQESETK